MTFKTPKFWYKKTKSADIKSAILMPIATLYQKIHKQLQSNIETKRVDIPVICVGNATAGGAGKTPTAIAISKLLTKNNLKRTPHFLTRGYTAKNTSTRCISGHEPVHDTGDEPKILSSHCKTIISVNRYEGAKMAQNLGSDCVIMDDGYQNKTLYKDISFLVIDGNIGFGNNKTIPAGPLRENIKSTLDKASAIILLNEDRRGIINTLKTDIPVFKGAVVPKPEQLDHIKNKNIMAFCGLANPDKFYNTINELELSINKKKSFPDHYIYTEKDVQHLCETAKKHNLQLLTTEKDFVKIPEKYHNEIAVLPIEIKWKNESELIEFLRNNLPSPKT